MFKQKQSGEKEKGNNVAVVALVETRGVEPLTS